MLFINRLTQLQLLGPFPACCSTAESFMNWAPQKAAVPALPAEPLGHLSAVRRCGMQHPGTGLTRHCVAKFLSKVLDLW